MHVYHYAHYEETALKRLMCRYGTRENAVDDLLRHGVLVDLYQVVREALQVSEPRYSIKNMETFYMGKRQGEVTSARGQRRLLRALAGKPAIPSCWSRSWSTTVRTGRSCSSCWNGYGPSTAGTPDDGYFTPEEEPPDPRKRKLPPGARG